jgi:hypothetical protein
MRVFALVLVASLTLAAGANAAHYAGASAASFQDVAADGGTAADIGSVTASVDSSEKLTVRVGLSGRHGVVSVYIDSDNDPSTGAPRTGGADFVVDYDEPDDGLYFSKWTGSDWDYTIPHSTVEISVSSNELAFSMNRSELPGADEQFRFWVESVESWDIYSDGHYDAAPDDGMYRYAFGPLRLGLASFAAIAMKGVLVATAMGQRSDTGALLGAEGSVTCKATVAGKALPLATSGVLLTGKDKTPVATCAFVVSKKLRGKVAKGQLGFGLDGVWLLKTFTTKLK